MIYTRFFTVTFAFCIAVCHGEDDVAAPRYQALSRIIRAAHTTDLPEVDRVEVIALSIEAPFESKGQDRDPSWLEENISSPASGTERAGFGRGRRL